MCALFIPDILQTVAVKGLKNDQRLTAVKASFTITVETAVWVIIRPAMLKPAQLAAERMPHPASRGFPKELRVCFQALIGTQSTNPYLIECQANEVPVASALPTKWNACSGKQRDAQTFFTLTSERYRGRH